MLVIGVRSESNVCVVQIVKLAEDGTGNRGGGAQEDQHVNQPGSGHKLRPAVGLALAQPQSQSHYVADHLKISDQIE